MICNYKNVNEYSINIAKSENSIEDRFENFGCETEKFNKRIVLKKTYGEKESRITYIFDRHGNVSDVDVQLYYNSESIAVEDELNTVFDTISDEFDKADVDIFIGMVEDSISGNYKNGKLSSDNYTFRISRSSGYIDVHN